MGKSWHDEAEHCMKIKTPGFNLYKAEANFDGRQSNVTSKFVKFIVIP